MVHRQHAVCRNFSIAHDPREYKYFNLIWQGVRNTILSAKCFCVVADAPEMGTVSMWKCAKARYHF